MSCFGDGFAAADSICCDLDSIRVDSDSILVNPDSISPDSDSMPKFFLSTLVQNLNYPRPGKRKCALSAGDWAADSICCDLDSIRVDSDSILVNLDSIPPNSDSMPKFFLSTLVQTLITQDQESANAHFPLETGLRTVFIVIWTVFVLIPTVFWSIRTVFHPIPTVCPNSSSPP